MKKGKLYRIYAPSWMYDKDTSPKQALGNVPENLVVVYLDTSLREPYWHRVIYNDQVGYIAVYSFLEITDAEPETQAGT